MVYIFLLFFLFIQKYFFIRFDFINLFKGLDFVIHFYRFVLVIVAEIDEFLEVEYAILLIILYCCSTSQLPTFIITSMLEFYRLRLNNRKQNRRISYTYERHLFKKLNFRMMVFDLDLACIENIMMNWAAFYKLCDMPQSVCSLPPPKV